MDIISLTLPAALLAGLAFGAGPCNVTCLPYLGPVFLQGDGVRQSWKIILPFTTGRLMGYSLLGLAAGIAGQTLTEILQSSLAGWILGLAAIIIGVHLLVKPSGCNLYKDKMSKPDLNRSQEQAITFAKTANTTPSTPLFMMGAGMAFNPCVPLTAILAAAAASGSAVTGMSLGIAFGVGAVLIPAIVFGFVIAHFGYELKQQIGSWSKHVEKASGILLIILGLTTAIGWVQP